MFVVISTNKSTPPPESFPALFFHFTFCFLVREKKKKQTVVKHQVDTRSSFHKASEMKGRTVKGHETPSLYP